MNFEEFFRCFASDWLRFIFTLAPFFVLSVHLALTRGMELQKRRRDALLIAGRALLIAVLIYFSGSLIFRLVGITIDSFKVGAGLLLFASAFDLARGTGERKSWNQDSEDITVVPMSIPVIVGPAVTGTLMVMGGEASTPLQKMVGCSALGVAMFVLGMILFFGSFIERLIRRRGVEILSKLSGMVLAALSAEMVLSGARPFFK